MKTKGYIHVYTGNGKGKTTAAIGLSLRALGAGKKVFIGQFVKGKPYSEFSVIEKYLKGIKVKQYGLDCFIYNKPDENDINAARKGLAEMREYILSGDYDVVIMDELNIALYYELFDVVEVMEILENKPLHVEIVITGRYAHERIIKVADLVTEMVEVKHYYSKGVEAREGIEF